MGPAGEEVHTDAWGRIKVQFHWDRDGQSDENSSCWVRVGQMWAGPSFGTFWVPRVGMEVIIVSDSAHPVVSTRLWYNVGAANEDAGTRGCAHLFEHRLAVPRGQQETEGR